jgi:hypothetical protein
MSEMTEMKVYHFFSQNILFVVSFQGIVGDEG